MDARPASWRWSPLRAGSGSARPRPTSPSLPRRDLDRVLDGADVVLIQMRVGGLDARVLDETFPRAFGLPGEETMGPGGFANALRTVPALATAWDSIAARAPTPSSST